MEDMNTVGRIGGYVVSGLTSVIAASSLNAQNPKDLQRASGAITIPERNTSSDATIQVVAEKPIWITNGCPGADSNGYVVFVEVDNHGLNGQPTDGVQWRLAVNTNGLTYLSHSVPAPEADFFGGEDMFIDDVREPGQLSMRIINEIGGGPIDTKKEVGEYRYFATAGLYGAIRLDGLSGTALVSPSNQSQPHTLLPSQVIGVFPSHVAGRQECMSGPGAPYIEGFCSYYDTDGDGDVDLRDVADQDNNPQLLK